jgi:hypothetical protein
MILALSNFWEAFFLLMIWVPLVMLWITACIDVFNRYDLTGFAKAMWLVCIILLPFLGVLVYLIVRPRKPAMI